MPGLLDDLIASAGPAFNAVVNPIGAGLDAVDQIRRGMQPPPTTRDLVAGGPNKAQRAADAYKAGAMSDAVRARYEDAVKAGVVTDPYASARMNYRGQEFGGRAPGQSDRLASVLPAFDSGGTWGGSAPLFGALYGAQTGVGDLLDAITGKKSKYSPIDAFNAAGDEERAQLRANMSDYPVTSLASTVAGGLAAPGGGALGGWVRGPAGATRLAQAGRGAVAGSGLGAGAGIANAAPGQSLEDAARNGATFGAITGGAAPYAAAGLSSAARAGGGALSTLAQAANRAAGGGLLDAQRQAAMRLASSLRADGATPDLARAAMNEWLRVGGPSPTLADIASRLPNGGKNTLGLLRLAATNNPAAGAYADRVAGSLQDNAIARTAALTPDNAQPAPAVQAAATAARRAMGNADYAVPKATPVDAGPVIGALDGDAGARAIAAAARSADIARDPVQLAELQRLRQASEGAPQSASISGSEFTSPSLAAKINAALGRDPASQTVPVTLGALSRVERALYRAGRGAEANPETAGDAPFFYDRASEIRAHLNAADPDYATATERQAAAHSRIDALAHGGDVLNAAPDVFEAGLADLIHRGRTDLNLENIAPARDMAQIGARQALTDAFGAPQADSLATVNRIGNAGTNVSRNLAATYGDQAAGDYQASIANMGDQLKTARYVAKGEGGDGRGVRSWLDLSPRGMNLVVGIAKKIRMGASLTDQEKAAMLQLGLSPYDPGSMAVGQSPSIDLSRLSTAAVPAVTDAAAATR